MASPRIIAALNDDTGMWVTSEPDEIIEWSYCETCQLVWIANIGFLNCPVCGSWIDPRDYSFDVRVHRRGDGAPSSVLLQSCAEPQGPQV